jgi:hypothetical protein|tara:strand:+ start:120 stop:239 length:120 start_codon:yes stop_codon:yes gene_type:complete
MEITFCKTLPINVEVHQQSEFFMAPSSAENTEIVRKRRN